MRRVVKLREGSVRASATRPTPVHRGSGNVFADLGLPDAELALAKAELVRRIREQIDFRGLTRPAARRLLGLDRTELSALIRGRIDGYALDHLFRFLNALGQRIEITVRPSTTGDRRSVVVL